MSAFDQFLAAVEFIRPKYMMPLFTTISMLLSMLFSPLATENFYHEFTKPEKAAISGDTIEITSDYKIIIGENATTSERHAAYTLYTILSQINGQPELTNWDDRPVSSAKEICVGVTNRDSEAGIDRSKLDEETVIIKTVGEKIFITGGSDRSNLYAVYTFLQEYFGCRWFAHDLKVIPKAEKLIIPAEIDYNYTPQITYRSTDWISPSKSNEYKVANKLNSNLYGYLDDEYLGGGISYAGTFAHSLGQLIDPALFYQNPDIFALGVTNGERTPDQLCLTNPQTIRLVIKSVRRWLDENPNAKIISVTQNDNQNYCVCKKCKALDEAEGSHAGTMISFVNAIADDIKEDYPDVMVDTFAYQYTRKPPKTVVPRDNVIVRLCSIECKFSTPLDSGECKENDEFVEDLKAWSKICKNLHIWDYTTNYRSYLAPFADFDVLQENLQLFAENNVIGVYEEGNYSAAECDGEFAELRCYMLANLMWDPYCDIDELMYDFCEAYYGDGAQNIVDFINYIDKNSGGLAIEIGNWWITPFPNKIEIQKGLGIYAHVDSALTLRIKKSDVGMIDEMWQKAKDGAQTEWQKENVERSEICWRYWKANMCYGEFEGETRLESNQKLYEDFQRFGITRIHEGEGKLSPNPDLTMVPQRWVA